MTILSFILPILFFLFCPIFPPMGIGYYLLDQRINKRKYQRQADKKRKINTLIDRLHTEGILYQELKKADRGESKYFKRVG